MNWVGILKENLDKDRSCSAPLYTDVILSGQHHIPEMEMSVTVWKLGNKLTETFKKKDTNKKELKQLVAKMMLDRLNVEIPKQIVESPQVVHQQLQPMASTSCTTRLDQPTFTVTYSGFEHLDAILQSKPTREENLLPLPIPSTSNQNIHNGGASFGAEMNDGNTSGEEFMKNKNYKGLIQEFCMANRFALPVYTVLEHSGPGHRPSFKVQCRVDQKHTLEETRQEPKKQVEQRLAYMMLNLLTPKSNNLGNTTEERSTKLCEFMAEEGMPPVEKGNFNLEYKIISVDQIPGSSNAVMEIHVNGQTYSFYGDGANLDKSVELAKQNAEYFISDVMSRSSGNLSVLSK